MKVLLDEDLDHRLRKGLGGHEVFTVSYLGWAGLKNGELLLAAEQRGIDVFVTGDQNLSYQQNLGTRRLAILTLSATNWPIIRNHMAKIAAAIDMAMAGSFQAVDCGRFYRKRQRQ
jgi:hypothetical protein